MDGLPSRANRLVGFAGSIKRMLSPVLLIIPRNSRNSNTPQPIAHGRATVRRVLGRVWGRAGQALRRLGFLLREGNPQVVVVFLDAVD